MSKLLESDWLNGTEGVPSSDPYKVDTPLITYYDPTNIYGELRADSHSLPNLPPDLDVFGVYFEHGDPPIEEAPDACVPYVSKTASSIDLDPYTRFHDFLSLGSANQNFQSRGIVRHLWIQRPALSGSVAATLTLVVPYCWPNRDLALTIWELSRFFGIAGATGQLDKPSFLAYSEAMVHPFFRQYQTLFRKVGRSIQDQILDLLDSSNAILAFGTTEYGAVPMRPSLRVLDWRTVALNDRLFDWDDGGALALASARPEVSVSDRRLINSLSTKWGDLVRIRSLEVWTSDLEEPANPKSKRNVITREDATSVAAFGRHHEEIVAHLVDTPQSAEGSLRLEQWNEPTADVVVPLGPLHLDFAAGDTIKVRDSIQGLAGTEEIFVEEKEIELDTQFAVSRGFVVRPPAFELDLADVGDLYMHFAGDQGMTLGAGADINQWNDLSGNARHAVTLSRGTVGKPQKLTAYRNGLDAVDLRKSGGNPRGFDLPYFAGLPEADQFNWLIVAIGEVVSLSDDDAPGYLLSTQEHVNNSPWHVGVDVNDLWGWWHGGAAGGAGAERPVGRQIVFSQMRQVADVGGVVLAGHDSFSLADYFTGAEAGIYQLVESLRASGVSYPLDWPRGGFNRDTALGCHYAGTGNAIGWILFELAVYRIKAGAIAPLPRELEGIYNRLVNKWES